MTNKEKLDWLYRLRSKICVYMPKEWLVPMTNALDMAIKSSEQEPCEDTISRADMLDAIGHGTTYTSEELQRIITNLPHVEQEPCEDCIRRADLIDKTIKRNSIWLKITDSRGMNLQEIIDELPSVTPTRKHGKWTLVSINDMALNMYCCSLCGDKTYADTNFCPNCGADMRKEQNNG